jgi:tetratricopeptide (TPR) repeat protein
MSAKINMKKSGPSVPFLIFSAACFFQQALPAQASPQPKVKSEESLFLDLQKTGLGSMTELDEKRKFIETIKLEKQRIQSKMLVNVYESAFEYYRAGNYEDAKDIARKILAIDPNFEDAGMLLEASDQLRGSLRPGLSEKLMIEDRFKSALSLYNEGRILDAHQKMQEVVKLSPNNIKGKYWLAKMKDELCDYYYKKGDQLYVKRDFKGALDNLYSALMIKPRNSRIVDYITRVETELRQETANAKLKTALEYYAQGNLREAYNGLNGVLEVQPGDPKASKLLAEVKNEIEQSFISRGRKLYGDRKYTEAIGEWGKAKPYTANLAYLDRLISRAKEQMRLEADDKRRRADEAARRAREEEERRRKEEAERKRAEAEGKLKDATEAPGKAKLATEENRRTAQQHYLEGLKYFQNSNYEKARDEWVISKQLDPGNVDVESGLKRIDQLQAGSQ